MATRTGRAAGGNPRPRKVATTHTGATSRYTMSEDLARIISFIVVVVIAVICVIYLNIPDYTEGTLYLTDSNEPICSGRLKAESHMYGPETYEFECSDGKIIQNLTNFTVR